MRRLAALGAAAALMAGGCGGDSEGGSAALSATADKLGEIRSGKLSMSLTVEPRGQEDARTGFEMEGPFALGDAGSLPQADIDFTQLAGSEKTELSVISTGRRAFACADGRLVALPDEQAESLRSAGGEDNPAKRFGLDVESWVDDPQIEDAGDDLERVTGDVDVVAVIEDALGATGREAPEMGDGEKERLRESVQDASFELVTGKEDRLLRKVDMRFDVELPARLRQASGLSGGLMRLELSVDDPNGRVSVREPDADRCAG